LRKLTFGDGFIWLAFAIGLGIRLAFLGVIPLNDTEAKWALQALELSKGGAIVGAQAGAVLWSGILFFVFGSGNVLARFFPAVIGSLVILTPLYFQEKLGKTTPAILAFGLALDPLLIGVSRQVDGLSMSIALAGLAAGFFFSRKSLLFGLCLGLFLLTGPSAWLGLLILAVIVCVNWLFFTEKTTILSAWKMRFNWKMALLGFGISLFIGGTLFMLTPTGISGALDGLATFVKSWKVVPTYQNSTAIIVMAGLSYLLMPLVLGVTGMIQGIKGKDRFDLLATSMVLIVIFVLIIYPGFEIRQLAWLSPFLWVLTSRQIQRMQWSTRTGPAIMMGLITLVMLIFALMNLNTVSNLVGDNSNFILRILAIGVSLVIILLSGLLVWWGWSLTEARFGLGVGLLCILIGLTLTSTWRSTGLNGKINCEMINQSPVFVDEDLMIQSIGDLSEWNTGEREFLDVVMVDVTSPALNWALRDLVNYQKTNSIIPGGNPGIIIANPDSSIGQTELYTGQEFTIREVPVWNELTGQQWIGWLMRRELPFNSEAILLWARSDLFPGATTGD
jgi:hypothetical protein